MKNNEIVHLPAGVVLPTADCGVRLPVSDKEEWLRRQEDYSAIALIGASSSCSDGRGDDGSRRRQ